MRKTMIIILLYEGMAMRMSREEEYANI